MVAIFRLTLRALARGRRLLVVAVLLAVPALLALVYQATERQPNAGRFAIGLFDSLYLPVLLPLTALIFATSALGSEIEDRTLMYLTLKPISRLAVATAKLLAAALVTLVLVEGGLLALYLIALRGPASSQSLGALLLAGLGGSLAYVSLFLLMGLLAPRRALVAGFIYVLLWEGTAAGLSTALATLSVRRYVLGTLHAGLGNSPLTAYEQAVTVSGATSAIVLVLVVAAGLALTTWGLHRTELP